MLALPRPRHPPTYYGLLLLDLSKLLSGVPPLLEAALNALYARLPQLDAELQLRLADWLGDDTPLGMPHFLGRSFRASQAGSVSRLLRLPSPPHTHTAAAPPPTPTRPPPPAHRLPSHPPRHHSQPTPPPLSVPSAARLALRLFAVPVWRQVVRRHPRGGRAARGGSSGRGRRGDRRRCHRHRRRAAAARAVGAPAARPHAAPRLPRARGQGHPHGAAAATAAQATRLPRVGPSARGRHRPQLAAVALGSAARQAAQQGAARRGDRVAGQPTDAAAQAGGARASLAAARGSQVDLAPREAPREVLAATHACRGRRGRRRRAGTPSPPPLLAPALRPAPNCASPRASPRASPQAPPRASTRASPRAPPRASPCACLAHGPALTRWACSSLTGRAAASSCRWGCRR